MKIYETYGFGSEVKTELIHTDLSSNGINKPKSCWWGSPVGGDYTWKEWCIAECFKDEDYFDESNRSIWTLKEGSNIYTIEDLEDLYFLRNKGYYIQIVDGEKYPLPSGSDISMLSRSFMFSRIEIDFEQMCKDGYAAIELENPVIGHMFIDQIELSMNSWDCQSIAVLDSTKIIPLKKEEKLYA